MQINCTTRTSQRKTEIHGATKFKRQQKYSTAIKPRRWCAGLAV